MRFIEFIWKNIAERPTRTLLTTFGLAVAVAAITTLWAVALGYVEASHDFYTERDVDIVVVRAGVSNRATSRMDAEIERRIASVAGVARVDGVLTEIVTLGSANLLGIPLRGYAPKSPQLNRFEIIRGRRLTGSDRNVVLLGNAVAASLSEKDQRRLEIEGTLFDVAGVYRAENPFDSNCIVTTLADVQALMDRPDVVSEFQVAVDSTRKGENELNEVCRQIESLQDRSHQSLALKAQPTHDFVSSATETKLSSAMAWATTIIVVALSILGMLNTMLMSVLDRRSELGILRAVGWTRAQVVRLILGESFVISLISAALGSVGAWCAIQLFSHWQTTSLLVPAGLPLSSIGLGLIAAIATGVLGTLYPALHAAGIPPIDSLRHE
jgi:putative ABC transport system permease protein